MIRILAFFVVFQLPSLLFCQDAISRDTVDLNFWGSTFWKYSNSVDQIRDPLSNALLSVRKYFSNTQISEEYLRVSDSTWLYQQYDSLDPTRVVTKGLYVSDPDVEVMDTILNFDPTTYEESIHLRYARYAFKTGPWIEKDHNGYIWTGEYEDDLREGLWQKRDAYDYTELRGYLYAGGEVVQDSTLNWALSTDTARIAGLLTEGVVPGQRGGLFSVNTPGGLWRLCSVSTEVFGKNKIWQFTHLDYLPGQCSNESWGSFVFLSDHSLLFGLTTGSGFLRDEGRWALLDGNKLLLSLKKRGDTRFQMKYLADGSLTLVELLR